MAENGLLGIVFGILVIILIIVSYFATRKGRALVTSGDPFSKWKSLALKLGLTLELRENPAMKLKLGKSDADKIPVLSGVLNGRQVEAGIVRTFYGRGGARRLYAWTPCQTGGFNAYVTNAGLLQKIGVNKGIDLGDHEFGEKFRASSNSPAQARIALDLDARQALKGLAKKVFPIDLVVGTPVGVVAPSSDSDPRKEIFARGECVYLETIVDAFGTYEIDEEGLAAMIEAAIAIAGKVERG